MYVRGTVGTIPTVLDAWRRHIRRRFLRCSMHGVATHDDDSYGVRCMASPHTTSARCDSARESDMCALLDG